VVLLNQSDGEAAKTAVAEHAFAVWDAKGVSPQRLLITGASGTLGYNIVRRLGADPRKQLLVPLRNIDPGLFVESANLKTARVDLADDKESRAMIRDFCPTTIIHCAASGVRPARPMWFDMLSFNVTSTLRLFEASCALQKCHFIYVSTGLVYLEQGRPLSETDPIGSLHPYGASKAAADHLLQAAAVEFGRTLTILRPFSFTGQHDGGNRLFPGLLSAAVLGKPFLLSPGEQIRDFCSVQDIADAVGAVMDRADRRDAAGKPAVEVFNLGSGVIRSIRSIVENVCDQLDLGIDLRFGALPYHSNEVMHLVANIEKVKSISWKPRINLAFAVWQLARTEFPRLSITRPPEEFCPV
jgi:UDP-glucose 4-epimerase